MSTAPTSSPARPADEDVCGFCGTSLRGADIPAASRHLYGGKTYFGREIGVETDDYDGVLYWVCPDCHHAWPRFTGAGRVAGSTPGRLEELATAAVAAHEESRALLADADTVAAVLATHAHEVAFAVGMAGFRWTGWAVCPRTGARLYLLIDGTSLVDPAEGMRLFDQAQSLARDITGLPVVVLGAAAPAVEQMADAVRPARLPPPQPRRPHLT